MSGGRVLALAASAVAALAAACWWLAADGERGAGESDPGQDPAAVRTSERTPRARAKPGAAPAQAEIPPPVEAGGEEPAAKEAPRRNAEGGTVIGDAKEGEWVETYADGRPKRRGSFKKSRRDGLWTEWTPDGGRSETEWRNGRRHGREAAWRKDGSPRFEGTYDDERMSGVWTSWHENGTLHTTREYVDGKLHGYTRTYHDNGTVESESVYANGIDVAPTRGWHANGNLAFVMPYVEGKRQGEAVWYHENGAVSARGTYAEGVLHGEYRRFADDGTELPSERWVRGTKQPDSATADSREKAEEGR